VPWAWLVPERFTVWVVNRYAELFLVYPDGTVHWLATSTGELQKIADSRDDFADKIDQEDNANDWLMIPLVDRCVDFLLLSELESDAGWVSLT
jgi:hypothetical protein